MLADIMTKPIAAPQFDALRTKLGIVVADESSGSVVKTDVTTPRQATLPCAADPSSSVLGRPRSARLVVDPGLGLRRITPQSKRDRP
ncbi:hypothetical protein PHYSODRAFT_333334 [Phytophthora sojae]|uniref:Uncharacterized protein n=1 Tax=Phytophthora sojae (strain P6497) TaxID=1094619 RepID=G4ZN30_PHYSP|nr:hypothetical protein PHYSODRAFT_333334 [Phytophthora sojae]EGZ15059.1 hypothetical protein PHYSODRAFT_333334 [Phytophthora sojae]|eukprot:XP_009528808.1 hypothetical protein PHYSODRAFT_333334 [Phytophthora sojae]